MAAVLLERLFEVVLQWVRSFGCAERKAFGGVIPTLKRRMGKPASEPFSMGVRDLRDRVMRAALGLSLAALLASCGRTLSSDAIAFDQLQLVRDCGFSPRNCDEFFGPQGFEQAYSRVLGKLSPGDREADSLPGSLFRFAYYKNMRRVDDHYGGICHP